MSLENLDRRIDKMLAAIEPQQEPVSYKYTFAMHLFSEQEQVKLQAFLDLLESKYYVDDKGRYRLNYGLLSVTEWDQLDLWCSLEQALMEEDLVTAAKCRRWLAMSLDDLLKAFLTIDLSFLPDDINEPGPRIVEAHCVYSLNRSNFNNIVGNHIERGRVTALTIEEVRRWLDYVDRMHNSAIIGA